MPTITLTDTAGQIASILEIPDHATDSVAAGILASAWFLARARHWDASTSGFSSAVKIMAARIVGACLAPDLHRARDRQVA